MVSDLMKEKVLWTKEMNLALAKYMEDKPSIWDTKHPKFSNIGLRDEIFAKFASRYDLSWMAVKERWTNIRSTYGFYMRKIQARKAKGQECKVNWFMWKPCKYLYKVHKFSKNVPAHSKESVGDLKSDGDNMSDHESQEDNSISNESQSDIQNSNVSCEEIVENIATVFKGVQNELFSVDNSKYAAVGQAVTRKLSQLNSYEAARLSQKILEILAEYDEYNPMNPNNPTP